MSSPKCKRCESIVGLFYVSHWRDYFCNPCGIQEAFVVAVGIASEMSETGVPPSAYAIGMSIQEEASKHVEQGVADREDED